MLCALTLKCAKLQRFGTERNKRIHVRDSYRILGLGGDSTPRGVWRHVHPGKCQIMSILNGFGGGGMLLGGYSRSSPPCMNPCMYNIYGRIFVLRGTTRECSTHKHKAGHISDRGHTLSTQSRRMYMIELVFMHYFEF